MPTPPWIYLFVITPFLSTVFADILNRTELRSIPESILEKIDGIIIDDGHLSVNDVKVTYLESFPNCGNETADSCVKHDILLLHGAAYSAETWRRTKTMKYLSAMGHHVIAVNLPRRAVGDKATFMVSLIEGLELFKPVVLSPSYSGSYSIPYFMKHHEDMGAYIPVSPGAANRLDNEQDIQILKTIKTPVFNMIGEHDGQFVEFTKRIFGNVRHFAHLEVKNGRHAFYIRHQDIFHKALFNFLERINNIEDDE